MVTGGGEPLSWRLEARESVRAAERERGRRPKCVLSLNYNSLNNTEDTTPTFGTHYFFGLEG